MASNMSAATGSSNMATPAGHAPARTCCCWRHRPRSRRGRKAAWTASRACCAGWSWRHSTCSGPWPGWAAAAWLPAALRRAPGGPAAGSCPPRSRQRECFVAGVHLATGVSMLSLWAAISIARQCGQARWACVPDCATRVVSHGYNHCASASSKLSCCPAPLIGAGVEVSRGAGSGGAGAAARRAARHVPVRAGHACSAHSLFEPYQHLASGTLAHYCAEALVTVKGQSETAVARELRMCTTPHCCQSCPARKEQARLPWNDSRCTSCCRSPVVDLQYVAHSRRLFALHDSTFCMTAFQERRNRSGLAKNLSVVCACAVPAATRAIARASDGACRLPSWCTRVLLPQHT